MPEGEEEEQEIVKLFEKIVKNFPNLAKEIDFQEIQEAHRVPKKLDPRHNFYEAHSKAHHNYISQD